VKSVLTPDKCNRSVECGSQFQPVHVSLFSKAVVLLMQHVMQLLHTTAAALDIDISVSAFQFAWAIHATAAQCHVYPLQLLLLGLVSQRTQ
jgi:hypothetical protein